MMKRITLFSVAVMLLALAGYKQIVSNESPDEVVYATSEIDTETEKAIFVNREIDEFLEIIINEDKSNTKKETYQVRQGKSPQSNDHEVLKQNMPAT